MKNFEAIGNLTRDAELKEINGKNYIVFSLAINSRNKEGEPEYIGCMKNAENGAGVLPYLTKGSKVYVSGDIKARLTTYKNENIAELNLFVYNLELLSTKKIESNVEDEEAPF